MHIVESSTRPHDIESTAALMHAEFAHLYPEWTIEMAALDLRASREADDDTGILLSWFAIVDDEVVGTVQLRAGDEVEPPDATVLPGPWLAGLLVVPDHRGRGIASALVDHVTEQARRRGIERLRLVTEHEAAFYERRGWTVERSVTLAGHPNTVMLTTLRP